MDRLPRLAADLRKIVKGMADEPIFSTRWFTMLTALQHITDVAVTESKKVGDDKGDSTLWERNELIVRYLLEEGKLNLTIRLLVEFKDMQRGEQFAQALQKAQANEPGAQFDDVPTIKIKAALFEQRYHTLYLATNVHSDQATLGVLLSCAISSVESLQTLDMPLLIGHMGRTLTFSLTHSEMLQEDRIMDLIAEHGILSLLIRNLSHTKILASKAMSGILASEDFKTDPDKYLPTAELKKQIVQMEEDFVKDTFSDFSSKKQVRGLLDTISRLKYQLPKD